MQTPGMGLFGVGRWGRQHLRVLRSLCGRVRAWDPSPEAMACVPPDARAASEEDLLTDPGIAAVVVASPARTHFELASRVLQSGRDVFVEKPLTLDEREGRRLVEQAEDQGRVLMVGHITLYHPALRVLAELTACGRLGRLRYLTANRLNLGTVREEEDILWSFAPHDLAVMLQLTGSWPARVSAVGGSYLQEGRADVTVTHLEFPGGVRAHVYVSWLHPFKEHSLVVIGDRAMASFRDGPAGGELRLFDQPLDDLRSGVRPPASNSELVPFPAGEPLENELRHFVECVSTRRRPLTDGSHGLEVLRILETARTSLLESGLPCDCPPPVEVPQ